MRLTEHADGWTYGLFCTERKDRNQPNDESAAVAQCGIARTRDLVDWERLPDLVTNSGQQRNVVLHPEYVDGKYALYTRPQDGFISVGGGGGIGWGLADDMTHARVDSEVIVDAKVYHTIKEVKNGQGPTPIKTPHGWLHLAHGVRNTAAGLRYVLYLFMTALDRPWVVTHAPGGHFISPHGGERVGDVSNVMFFERLDRERQGQGFHLLRLVRHAHACRDVHARPADRLCDEHAAGPPYLGRLRRTAFQADPQKSRLAGKGGVVKGAAADMDAVAGEIEQELRDIAAWWSANSIDREQGGFHGEIDADNNPVPGAGKGIVLNARILWFFSAATAHLRDPALRRLADRALDYLERHFIDPGHGGVYWELDAEGRALDTKKQGYAQAFAIYALCARYRATGRAASIERAHAIFALIEAHYLDTALGGMSRRSRPIGRRSPICASASWTPIFPRP